MGGIGKEEKMESTEIISKGLKECIGFYRYFNDKKVMDDEAWTEMIDTARKLGKKYPWLIKRVIIDIVSEFGAEAKR